MTWFTKLTATFRKPGICIDERRGRMRVECEFEASCRVGERDLPAVVLDLSEHGMRLRVPVGLLVSTPVRVSCTPRGVMQGRQRLLCRVSWSRSLPSGGAEVGLQVCDVAENVKVSWLQPSLRQLGAGRRKARRHRRFATAQTALLKSQSGKSLGMGVVTDLSLGGAMLQLDEALELGSVVSLLLDGEPGCPQLSLVARVVACSRDRGSKFHSLHLSFFRNSPQAQRELKSQLEAIAWDQGERYSNVA